MANWQNLLSPGQGTISNTNISLKSRENLIKSAVYAMRTA